MADIDGWIWCNFNTIFGWGKMWILTLNQPVGCRAHNPLWNDNKISKIRVQEEWASNVKFKSIFDIDKEKVGKIFVGGSYRALTLLSATLKSPKSELGSEIYRWFSEKQYG